MLTAPKQECSPVVQAPLRSGRECPGSEGDERPPALLDSLGVVLSAIEGVWAGSGADVLVGGGAGEWFEGGGGNDSLTGGGGNDFLAGAGGNDSISGGAGLDALLGEEGTDSLNGGPGIDDLSGGIGNDTVNSRDTSADGIACGGGTDTALVDRRDRVPVAASCERVRRL